MVMPNGGKEFHHILVDLREALVRIEDKSKC